MQEVIEFFEQFRLSKNEIKVLKMLKQFDEGITALDVSRNTDIHRSNTYDALNNLIKLGFCYSIEKKCLSGKGNRRYYYVKGEEDLKIVIETFEKNLKELLKKIANKKTQKEIERSEYEKLYGYISTYCPRIAQCYEKGIKPNGHKIEE